MAKTKLMFLIRFRNKNASSIQNIICIIEKNGGLQYAEELMLTYASEAKALLNQFEDTIYRQAFLALIDFTVHRKK
jgi:octaprenyl-diphosphate synthase